MRTSAFLLLVILFFVGCENPGETAQDIQTYQGKVVQSGPAPFLLNGKSLAKTASGTILIEESTSSGTVYGLLDESAIYAADGGEALPKDTWIDNQTADPIEVSLTDGLIITFDGLSAVTIIEAENIFYVDENGDIVAFSGAGVIETTEISTGTDGAVTLISSIKFAIGGDGGDTV